MFLIQFITSTVLIVRVCLIMFLIQFITSTVLNLISYWIRSI